MPPSVVPAAIAGLMFCVLASSGSAQTPNVKLMLDFSIQGQQSPFVLAAEGGYFARAGVNVEVDRGYGSADAITKVAGRAYDMAFADTHPVAEEVEHHQAERSCRQAARVAA